MDTRIGRFVARLLSMWNAPKGRFALFVGACGAAFLDAILLLADWKYPGWAFFLGLGGIMIAMPLYVIVGYDFARDREADLPSGEQFLLAHARTVLSSGALPIDDQREASLELARELANPRKETDYLAVVMDAIEANSAWAVCGRKSDQIATRYWAAAVLSHKSGNYIERVFLPPQDRQEVREAKRAITPHLDEQMLVRVFGPELTTPRLQVNFDLPGGFGMTLMGDPGPPNRKPERDPNGDLLQVLIHWGGLDERHPHFGVILQHHAWTRHFFQLFNNFRAATEIANNSYLDPSGRTMKWKEFVTKHKHYTKARK